MSEQIFISDLHLAEQRPDTVALFTHFLATRPKSGDQLFILGDLFDVWIGDDEDSLLADTIRTALLALTQRGVALFVQHGNRDFLIAKRFLKETGANFLADPTVLKVAGKPTLLMHGDLLCSDDVRYLKARKKLRHPLFRWYMKILSLKKRRAIAINYRQQSKETKAVTTADIMDVNQDTVMEYFTKHHVNQMIHGHTHRPAMHQYTMDNGNIAIRWVLPEWKGNEINLLVANDQRINEETFTC